MDELVNYESNGYCSICKQYIGIERAMLSPCVDCMVESIEKEKVDDES